MSVEVKKRPSQSFIHLIPCGGNRERPVAHVFEARLYSPDQELSGEYPEIDDKNRVYKSLGLLTLDQARVELGTERIFTPGGEFMLCEQCKKSGGVVSNSIYN